MLDKLDKMQKIWLSVSLGIAVVFHIVLLLFLYDLPISSDLLRQKSISFNESGKGKTAEEIENREQQLQKAFSRWAKPKQDTVVSVQNDEQPSFNIDIDASVAATSHYTSLLDMQTAHDFANATRQMSVAVNFDSDQTLQKAWEATNYTSTKPQQKQGQEALSSYLSSKEKGKIVSSGDYIFYVDYAKLPTQEGYLFRLMMLINPEHHLKRIRQNYYFLIDRSNSIGKKQYDIVKSGVADVLSHLHEGDTFNILIFDHRLIAMSEKNVSVGPTSIAYAREWLQGQPHGGLFATTELYSSLMNIIPEIVGEQEVHTAILFSDGDTSLSRDEQRKNIAQWNDHNHGKISLYCVAAGKGNNLALLNLISTFNRGALYYGSRQDEIPSLIEELIYAVDQPIGKDLLITALQGDKEINSLQPKKGRLGQLYVHQPLVIYGQVDRLDDIHLFVQGKYYDRRFDINQKIALKNGQQLPFEELNSGWTIHRANDIYSLYLQDGNMRHLNEVRRLFAAEKFPVAFQ